MNIFYIVIEIHAKVFCLILQRNFRFVGIYLYIYNQKALLSNVGNCQNRSNLSNEKCMYIVCIHLCVNNIYIYIYIAYIIERGKFEGKGLIILRGITSWWWKCGSYIVSFPVIVFFFFFFVACLYFCCYLVQCCRCSIDKWLGGVEPRKPKSFIAGTSAKKLPFSVDLYKLQAPPLPTTMHRYMSSTYVQC